eukprot:TRINITY_DN34064_c0_g2_i1.p3 TRINITY_DN34064_c0_g2~~TRINITY_DN34064_c0_g2_i1.p3  ORF type:complete len:180 (-),score=54.85 TRINITY_DN34064_c0_g2_i1:1494-2033(-)
MAGQDGGPSLDDLLQNNQMSKNLQNRMQKVEKDMELQRTDLRDMKATQEMQNGTLQQILQAVQGGGAGGGPPPAPVPADDAAAGAGAAAEDGPVARVTRAQHRTFCEAVNIGHTAKAAVFEALKDDDGSVAWTEWVNQIKSAKVLANWRDRARGAGVDHVAAVSIPSAAVKAIWEAVNA